MPLVLHRRRPQPSAIPRIDRGVKPIAAAKALPSPALPNSSCLTAVLESGPPPNQSTAWLIARTSVIGTGSRMGFGRPSQDRQASNDLSQSHGLHAAGREDAPSRRSGASSNATARARSSAWIGLNR